MSPANTTHLEAQVSSTMYGKIIQQQIPLCTDSNDNQFSPEISNL